MTQTEKDTAIRDLKADAFDASQMMERGKYMHNKILEELIKLEQTPVDDELALIDKTDGTNS